MQSNTLNSYPAALTLTTLICAMGTGINGSMALVAERHDMSAWVIGLDTRLFTVVYSVSSAPQSSCMHACMQPASRPH